MNDAKLYVKLRKGAYAWDEEVYRLARSMWAAFKVVVDSGDESPPVVIEVSKLRADMDDYEARQQGTAECG